MWVVGSIGIVIVVGDWAGFGPLLPDLCCFKRQIVGGAEE
jgi:hypothetical protein